MNKNNYEQESNGKNPGNFLTGLFLGGLAGAVTMLLLAPQSGEKTRKQLRQKAAEISDQTSSKVGEVVGQVRSKSDEIKANVTDKARELKKQGQEVLADQLDRVSAAAESGKKVIQGKES